MTSPVTNVHSPEVIMKKSPDRGLSQGVVIGDNNWDIIMDKVPVDGVGVHSEGEEGEDEVVGVGVTLIRGWGW